MYVGIVEIMCYFLDEGMKEVLVYSRTNTDVHVDQEKVLSWLKWIWREASPA